MGCTLLIKEGMASLTETETRLANYLLSHTGIKDMEIAWLPMKNTGENVAMCISMVVYTLANYCYNRFITFKTKSEKCSK